MEETTINAVEMVRAIRDRMHEETKGMSFDEYVAYIERKAGRLDQEREAAPTSTASRTAA